MERANKPLRFIDWDSIEAMEPGRGFVTCRQYQSSPDRTLPGPVTLESTFPVGGNADKGEDGEVRQLMAMCDGVLNIEHFAEIPDWAIELHHSGTDLDEIAASMIEAHGSDDFGPGAPVTLIFLRKGD